MRRAASWGDVQPGCGAGTFEEPFLTLSRRRIVMTSSLDDHSLVEACRAGQPEAFGALVQRHQERLYQTLVRLCGSTEDAKDVLQDTFLRAFQKLGQFHGDSSFYTWVYRIGVNLALSGHRRHHARPSGRRTGDFAGNRQEEMADESADADPTYALERAERQQIIESALESTWSGASGRRDPERLRRPALRGDRGDSQRADRYGEKPIAPGSL